MTSLFKAKTTTPTVTAAAVVPEADSTSVNQAKKRATEVAMQRAGRASTIMTSGNSTGSSDSYSSTALGA